MVGLMGSDMSALRFCGSVRVRVGSAMASGTRRRVCVASQGASIRVICRDISVAVVAHARRRWQPAKYVGTPRSVDLMQV
jgi:hypothetical protein